MKRKRIPNPESLPPSKRHKSSTLLHSILSLYTSTSSTTIPQSQITAIIIKNCEITGIFCNPSVRASMSINGDQVNKVYCSCGNEDEFWCGHVKTIGMVYDGQIEMGGKVFDLDEVRKRIENMDEQMMKVMLLRMVDEKKVEDYVEVVKYMNVEMNKEENEGMTIEKYRKMKKKEKDDLNLEKLSDFLPIMMADDSELRNNESYIDKEKFVRNLSRIITQFFNGEEAECDKECLGRGECYCNCHERYGYRYRHYYDDDDDDEGCDECAGTISYTGYSFDPIKEYMLKTMKFILRLANEKHFYNAFSLLDKVFCEFLRHDYGAITYDEHYNTVRFDTVFNIAKKEKDMFQYINYVIVTLVLSNDLPSDLVEEIKKNITKWIEMDGNLRSFIGVARSLLNEKNETFEKIITNQIQNNNPNVAEANMNSSLNNNVVMQTNNNNNSGSSSSSSSDSSDSDVHVVNRNTRNTSTKEHIYKLKLKKILNRDGLSNDIKITQIYYYCTYYRINFIKNLCEIYFKKYEAPIKAIENGEVTDLEEMLAILMLIFYSTHTENMSQCFEFIVSCIDTLPSLSNPFYDEDVMVDEGEEEDGQKLSNINNSIIQIIIQINITKTDFIEKMGKIGLLSLQKHLSSTQRDGIGNTALFVAHLIYLSKEKSLEEKQNLANGLFNNLKTWEEYSKLIDYLIGKEFDEKLFSYRLSQLFTIHICSAINIGKDFNNLSMREIFQKIVLLKDKRNEMVFIKNLLQYFHLEQAKSLYEDLNIVNFNDSRSPVQQKKISDYLLERNNIKNFRFMLNFSRSSLLPKHYIHMYRFIFIALFETKIEKVIPQYPFRNPYRRNGTNLNEYYSFFVDVSKTLLSTALMLNDEDDDGKKIFKKILEFYSTRIEVLKNKSIDLLKHFITFATTNVIKIEKSVLEKIGKSCEELIVDNKLVAERTNSLNARKCEELSTVLYDFAKAIGNNDLEVVFQVNTLEKNITLASFLEFNDKFPNHRNKLIEMMKKRDNVTNTNSNNIIIRNMNENRLEVYIHLKYYNVALQYLKHREIQMLNVFGLLDKHGIEFIDFEPFFEFFKTKLGSIFTGYGTNRTSLETTLVYLLRSRHRTKIVACYNTLEDEKMPLCKFQTYKKYYEWIKIAKLVYGVLGRYKSDWDRYINSYIKAFCRQAAKWRSTFNTFLVEQKRNYPPAIPRIPRLLFNTPAPATNVRQTPAPTNVQPRMQLLGERRMQLSNVQTTNRTNVANNTNNNYTQNDSGVIVIDDSSSDEE